MTLTSIKSTSPPYSRTASTFTEAEVEGITMTHDLPRSEQAYASAWPKLPDDAVMIFRSAIFEARLYAARNLKLPVCGKVSVAIVRSTPRRAAKRGASIIVVLRAASVSEIDEG